MNEADDKIKPGPEIPVNNLSGKDVGDFGKEVMKDTGKTALVWVLAGYITQGIRGAIDKFTKPAPK